MKRFRRLQVGRMPNVLPRAWVHSALSSLSHRAILNYSSPMSLLVIPAMSVIILLSFILLFTSYLSLDEWTALADVIYGHCHLLKRCFHFYILKSSPKFLSSFQMTKVRCSVIRPSLLKSSCLLDGWARGRNLRLQGRITDWPPVIFPSAWFHFMHFIWFQNDK